ncbi:exodeoxyribonuclease V subunit alpha [Alishewanella longhuensis]
MLEHKNLLAYQPSEVIALLAQWQQAGLISALDLALARFLLNQNATATSPQALLNSSTLLLAVLLSHQVGRGHVCLPLAPLFTAPEQLLNIDPEGFYNAKAEAIPGLKQLLNGLTEADLLNALTSSAAVFMANNLCERQSSIPYQGQPLVLALKQQTALAAADAIEEAELNALYLYRYWHYEQQIAYDLQRLMQPTRVALPKATMLNTWLDELFGADAANVATEEAIRAINWQKLACVNTLRSQFSVITGGPGTGKTYTVVRLLALLQRLQAQSHSAPLIIKLAAPTGKAAARLKESIQAAATSLEALPASWTEALAQISAESSTLHKLLGVQAGSRQFKHRKGKPLALDVLIVDEASMVDIELMHALLAALPKEARLVLLGDKDQLASVEAGAVLGQLCAGAEQGGYRPETLTFLQQFTQIPLPAGLAHDAGSAHLQHVVMLRVSRRFTDSSGIGALARAVNRADLSALSAVFNPDSGYADLALIQGLAHEQAEQQALIAALKQLCQQGFAAYWQAIKARPDASCSAEALDSWARTVLNTYQRFQLLTPVREGLFGVAGLNALVQKTLSFLPSTTDNTQRQDSWFEGRPVMVTANDYNLNLRNGDIGMVLVSPYDGQKRAVFIDSDNKVRWILPSRLTEVETVFAMTVHKSQGSEFAHTVMVLPDRDNPVLSRELLYTGITRAAKQLTLVVPDWQVLLDAVKRKTVRAGSLRV